MRLLVLVIALASAACLQKTEFKCTNNIDCSEMGAVCEPDRYCSFLDGKCASGRRYVQAEYRWDVVLDRWRELIRAAASGRI